MQNNEEWDKEELLAQVKDDWTDGKFIVEL